MSWYQFFPGLALIVLLVSSGCGSRQADPNGALARIARLQRACEVAAQAGEDLLPTPDSPVDATNAEKTLDRLIFAEKEWEPFRAWAALHAGPGTMAGLDRVWGEYAAARDALRTQLERWSQADPSPQPGLDAKRDEDYVRLRNRLSAACGALAEWAARVSPSDLGG